MIHQSSLPGHSRLWFLFLTITLFFTACKGPKAVAESTDTLPNSLLWKIEHKDMATTSYLFGTIHMIPREDFFLPTGLQDAFDKSDRVVFEINLDKMSDMNSMMGMMSGLMMSDGMSLKKILSPKDYAEASAYFEAMGMPMFLLDNVKPMFLSMLAQMNMDPEEMSSDDMASYEMELYDMANATSKPVGGLETMAYQMSLFDSIPYKDQGEMLMEAIRGTDLEGDLFEETVQLYKQQDIESMVAMVGDSDSGSYEDILLNNRNRNWIPLIKKKMLQGSIFFAVGAGHLGGDQGVIRLLRKEGYVLTPVSVSRGAVPKRV